jgi:hypothetical protein
MNAGSCEVKRIYYLWLYNFYFFTFSSSYEEKISIIVIPALESDEPAISDA